MWHKVIFKRSLTGLNSEIFFSVEELSLPYNLPIDRGRVIEEFNLPYYLPIDRGRVIKFTPFPKVLAQYKMQSHPGFELGCVCSFPTTLAITSRTPILFAMWEISLCIIFFIFFVYDIALYMIFLIFSSFANMWGPFSQLVETREA